MVLRSHLGNLAKAQNCRKTWFSTERKVKCLYKWLVWLYCRHFLSSPSLWLQSVCLPGPRLAWGFLHVQRETFHVTLPLKIPLPFLTAVVFIPAFFSLSPPPPALPCPFTSRFVWLAPIIRHIPAASRGITAKLQVVCFHLERPLGWWSQFFCPPSRGEIAGLFVSISPQWTQTDDGWWALFWIFSSHWKLSLI